MGLLLHCGANAVDEATLRALPRPLPMSLGHYPIPHGEFLDLVYESIDSAGMRVDETALGMTPDGNRMFGVLSVSGPDIITGDDYSLCVGLRGSHDMSLGRGISVGSRVFVCDNLAFSGEWSVKTKHTRFVKSRLPNLVKRVIHNLHDASGRQAAQLEAYKEAYLTEDQADAAMLDMLRLGIVNSQQLPRLVREWGDPSHREFRVCGPTVWRLFNSVTEVLKPRRDGASSTLPTLPAKTISLHAKCDQLALAA